MDKLKILLVGTCDDEAGCGALVAKLKTLQSSKAGPFDAVFVAGPVHPQILETKPSIPVYIQDDSLFSQTVLDTATKRSHDAKTKEKLEETGEQAASAPVDNDKLIELGDDMFLLRNSEDPESGGVWSLKLNEKKPPLVVAACPPRFRADDSSLVKHFNHVSYTGCDLLLSTLGPQGLEQYGIEGSYDIAAVALPARSRYHAVSSATGKFVQSPPFAHIQATTSTTRVKHTGRVLALGRVTPGKVDKSVKYIHALGLVPLHYGKPDAQPSNLLPNPFTDDSYEYDGNQNKSSRGAVGLSQASARRILQEESGQAHDHRWGRKRERDEGPPDPDATTLFIHGLHRDVTGALQGRQGDDLILDSLSKWNATQVRRPATANFCFVDFPSHSDALTCHSSLNGRISIRGVDLDVKWAVKKEGNSDKRMKITEKDAQDSSTLRYKITSSANNSSINNSEFGNELKEWMEKTLEKALAGDGDEVVKAADEPALQVACRIPEGSNSYGFLDFASHAAASMALATLTGSTDGGRALNQELPPKYQDSQSGIYLNWAKPASDDNVILDDDSGFTFTRQHFPADSRKDCWFCLASDTCERHLITGVYQQFYAAMPKGAVHDAHVLLIPVQHSSKGVLQEDASVIKEMDIFKERFRNYVKQVYDCELFVFERAIQTKGGYHTHVQCIPVPKSTGLKLQTTMLAQARRAGMQMTELNSDLGLKTILDDDSEGYFYAEIPLSATEYKRYFYKHIGEVMVPLQFGREVLAASLQKPELAHWKSCVVNQEKETELSSKLRSGFQLKEEH